MHERYGFSMTIFEKLCVFIAACVILAAATILVWIRHFLFNRPVFRNFAIIIFFAIYCGMLVVQVILLHRNKFWVNSICIIESAIIFVVIICILILDLPRTKDR